MIDALVLSPSSLGAYRDCHYRYYLQYVENHEGERSIQAARGVAVHAAAEAFLEGRLHWNPIGIEEAVEVYRTSYALESWGVDASSVHAKYEEIGERVVRSYLTHHAPEPLFVEEPIRITANGISISMHPDTISIWGVVHDLKVKAAKPRDPSVYADPMNTYALGYRALTGEIETDVQLDVMIALKRDEPYLVPISNGGPVSAHAIATTVAHYEDAAEGIDAGRFEPTGLETDACRYCHVRTVCAYVTKES